MTVKEMQWAPEANENLARIFCEESLISHSLIYFKKKSSLMSCHAQQEEPELGEQRWMKAFSSPWSFKPGCSEMQMKYNLHLNNAKHYQL